MDSSGARNAVILLGSVIVVVVLVWIVVILVQTLAPGHERAATDAPPRLRHLQRWR